MTSLLLKHLLHVVDHGREGAYRADAPSYPKSMCRGGSEPESARLFAEETSRCGRADSGSAPCRCERGVSECVPALVAAVSIVLAIVPDALFGRPSVSISMGTVDRALETLVTPPPHGTHCNIVRTYPSWFHPFDLVRGNRPRRNAPGGLATSTSLSPT